MARRRMICPTIWEDEDFAELSDKAKILFVACFSNADDDGRLVGNPAHLRSLAFRFNEKITIETVKKLSEEIATQLPNFILYEYNNRRFIQLLKWENHQTQRPDRRKPSKLPAFDGNTMSTICQPTDCVNKVKLSKVKLITEKDKMKDKKSRKLEKDMVIKKSITPTNKMFGVFQTIWLTKREKEYKFVGGKDGKTAQRIYRQCLKDDPKNPIGYYTEKVRLIMEQHDIWAFGGIEVYWNSTTKKKGKSWIELD